MKHYSFLRRLRTRRTLAVLASSFIVVGASVLFAYSGADGVLARLRTWTPNAFTARSTAAASRQDPNPYDPIGVAAPPTIDPHDRRYVDHGILWSGLQNSLTTVGDRFEVPGNERLTMDGLLTQPGSPQPVPVHIVTEWVDRARIQMPQPGGPVKVIGYDGQAAWASDGVLDTASLNLLNSIVFDSADHFFADTTFGAPIRDFGTRFRADDGTSPNYQGPYYDPYQITERVPSGQGTVEQTRLYYFNSDTKLLDRVEETNDGSGSLVTTEVFITWQVLGTQRVPAQIQRTDNDTPVFTLVVNSAVLTPHVDDGIFNAPTALPSL